jgi:RHS repeat-associated protein
LRVGAGAERTIGRSVYGESGLDPESSNSRGRVVEIRDQAGVVTTDDYDFKGNLLRRGRRLAQSYKTTLDWSSAVPLELETYTSRTRFDALNRPIQVVPPHSDQPGTGVNVIQPSYNDANLLERVHVWLDESAEPAGRLDPASASLAAVTNIEYDAKGRRTRLDRGVPGGNVVRTSYAYDRETFRLTHLYTRRGVDPGTAAGVAFTDDCETLQPSPATIAAPEAPSAGGSCGLQNLRYTYDAAGNITRLRDEAQQTIFFRNKRVEPSAEYTYDALYRLIEATGREHLGQVGGPPIPHSYNDAPRAALLHPGDGNVMGTYLERYVYDAAGNFLSWQHHHGTDPGNPGWNRTCAYHEPSALEPAKQSNRLTSTTIGGTTEVYSTAGNGYDAHGRMLRMPQLSVMQWSFTGQLQMTQRQAVNASDLDGVQQSGERTWYVYDSAGERVRKVTERAGGPVKDERLYLGGFEIYRRNGGAPLVRETLHVVDDHQQLALVETRVAGAEPGVPARVVRHQFGNHLGSASLELDDQAQIVSYEEYTPYGSTSYKAVRSTVEAKRYRYTGRERDEESGLYHNGARYHAPWLGRWTSTDPAGSEADPNLYRYSRNAPVMLKDPGGMDPPGAATPPYRLTPLLPDVNLTGMTGELQFHDVFSPDRSVSGRLGLSGTGRSAFILDVPGLHLNTTGLADLSGTAALDTSLGRGGLTLRGGLLLGDLSGLHLVVTGAGVFRIPVPDRIPLGGLPGSLLATIPQGEGEVNLTGALEAGSFSLATFRASASLAEGRFQGRLDATTVANLGRLRLDAAGTVSPEGDVSFESARLSANVGVPGFNLTLQGTGTATTGGNLALSANADLRLFGLPSLHAEGTGTASTSGADLSGRFYGPGPLYTSYITGNFSLSTRTGISADAAVFGLTYTPGVSVSSPVPDPPGLSVAAGGGPASPWTPEGLTLGVSYFRYQQGLFSHISGGFMPDLSQRIFTNPRVGVTAQWHF